MSWEEYIKANILEFRKRKLTEIEKNFVTKYKRIFFLTLYEPCQVVVINFNKPYPTFFVILHNAEHPDMEIETLENVAFENFSLETLRKMGLLKSLGIREIRRITKEIEKATRNVVKEGWLSFWTLLEKSLLFSYSEESQFLMRPFEFANDIYICFKDEILDTLREKQRKRIEKTVEDIKRDASAIEETELRTRILGKTERLEGQVKKLGEQQRKLREEVVGVRKLVGTSKTFGEWKSLLTEIDKMNTRIDAFSGIKDAYDKVLAQQNEFMKQQAEVMKQQSNFIKWIKYATILLPIAVISVPVIEIISVLIRHYLGIS